MRRIVVTQKGQPSTAIARAARDENDPFRRGFVQPEPRESTYGSYAAAQYARPSVLLSGLHPPTQPLMPLGAIDSDIDFVQAPLYRVPSSQQVIDSAMAHPTNRGQKPVAVVGESLGAVLARTRRGYF